MPAKLTTEEFVQKANNVHGNKYDYSNFVLINMTTKAEIICKVHGSFWQIPRDHVNSKSGCRKCSAEKASKRETMSFDEFLEKAKKAHGDKYSYYQETYVEARKKIKINCKLHGDFWQQGTNHYKGSDCRKCGIIKLKTTSKIKYDYVKKAKEIYGDLCDYSCTVYINSKSKIKYSCNKHGLIEQLPSDHIKSGCPKCGMERTAIKRTISFEKFVERATQIHGDKYSYDKDNYKNLYTKTKIICKKDHIFWQAPESHLFSKQGCPKCIRRISLGETAWLNYIGLPDDKEHRGVYIKIGNKRYFVDGYDTDRKICYEFNGDYYHGNPNKYNPNDMNKTCNKTYGELYERTLRRAKEIRDAGFQLISIWESDFSGTSATPPSTRWLSSTAKAI